MKQPIKTSKNEPLRQYHRLASVAIELDVSVGFVYKRIHAGDLEAVRFAGAMRVTDASLQSYKARAQKVA